MIGDGRTAARRALGVALGVGSMLAAAARGQDPVPAGAAPGAPRPPRIDGRFDDWPAGVTAFATADSLLVRVALPEEATLQGGSRVSRLLLDLDGKATTGKKDGDGRGEDALGVDLEIVLNPPGEKAPNQPAKPGLEIRAYDDSGAFDRVGHATIGFAFAPAFAARDFEFRVARETKLKEPAGSRFRASTRVRGRFVAFDPSGAPWVESPVFEAALPQAAREPAGADPIPAKPEGALRLVSWNVEMEGPEKNPPPFARVLARLDADVMHFQEWKTSDAELQAWFSAHLPSREPWRTHTYRDLGVSIVTHLPLAPLTPDRLMPERQVDGKKSQPIRFVAARIESPLGPLAAGSMHLKCCGAKDTYEDRLRIAQTESIHRFLRGVLANDSTLRPLLTGDMNLVGTRQPLDNLVADLDADGTDLAIADPYVIGGAGNYTWNDADSPFSPGRLDYALYADSELEVAQTFVLDVARLAPELVKSSALESDDFKASDHRPVVVDLRRKSAQAAAAGSSADSGGIAARPAPPLADLTGDALLALARDGAADATLVNLWATWCVPCVKELPDLIRLARERPRDKLRVVLVSCDATGDREKARALLEKLGVDFATYAKSGPDPEFIAAIDPDWSGTLPVTLVFDRAGKKTAMHQGQASYEELARLAGAAPAGQR